LATKIEMIIEGWSLAGILPEETGLEPAEIKRSNLWLNQIVSRYYDDGIMVPFLISDDYTDESGCTIAQEEALEYALAVKVMGTYAPERPLNESLVATAKNAKVTLRNRSFSTAKKSLPATLARGSGNTRLGRSWNKTFYTNKSRDRVILNNKEPIDDNDGSMLTCHPETFRRV